MIGLLHRGAPVVGVLDAPALGERYHAARGAGSFRSAAPLTTRRVERLEDAVLYCTTPAQLHDHPGHRDLRARTRWTSYGGDCLAYGWLAAGIVVWVAAIWFFGPAVALPSAEKVAILSIGLAALLGISAGRRATR